MNRIRPVARGVASLSVLAAVLVGVPGLLVRWGQWPIIGAPSGDWWSRLTETVVSDSTVFAVLTVAAWIVWATFAGSVLVELVAGLHGRQAPSLVFAGPLQRSARTLVVAVLMTLSLHQHAPAFATTASTPALPRPGTAPTAVVAVEPASPTWSNAWNVPLADELPMPDPQPPPDSPVAGEDRLVTVERNDSAWRLAEVHLGDGIRWRELWNLNQGVPQPDGRAWTDPQVIVPGWQLRLPGSAEPAVDAASVPQQDPQMVYVVTRGDTLSGIARDHLGDPARYTEIFDTNRGLEQPDGRRLTDPNLILPGWQLHLSSATPGRADTPEPTPPTGTAEPPAAEPTPSPDDSAQPPVTTPAPTPAPTAPPTSTPAHVPPPPPPSTTITPPRPPSAPESVDERGSSSPLPVLAGISGAVVLATGLALRIRTLRRRRATRGARHTHLPTNPTMEAITAAADVPLVRWAGQHLARLIANLDRRQLTGGPVAVELSEEAGIEVLWNNPQHAPAPDGWSVTDGGWAWRLAYDPEAPVPADELPAAFPALVTIGIRDGRQLMVDLEAFGVLTVTGSDTRVDALVRSLAVELATGNDLSDAYVSTVDVDTGLDNHVERVTVTDLDTATQHADRARRSIRDVLDHASIDDTFRARAGDTTPIEATVVIARTTGRDVPVLLAAVPPRCGVAVVLATDTPPTAGAHLLLDDAGLARLEPLGIVFTAVGMPRDTAQQLEETLTTLSQLPEDEPEMPRPAPVNLPVGRINGHHTNGQVPSQPDRSSPADYSLGNGHRPRPDPVFDDQTLAGTAAGSPATGDDPSFVVGSGGARLFHVEPDPGSVATAAPPMVVRVLGVPSIPERPELGRRELILTVLLACRGGTLAATAAQDALWGGKPVEAKTVWNFVAATRRALGEFDDGSPVMPSADRTRQTLRLDSRVTTDLALFAQRMVQAGESSTAEAMTLLREALGMVGGPPFDGAGYDWAHRDQDVAHASRLIEQAVEALVDLAVEAGQLDAARDAITRGLRGLPGNEELYRCRMRVEHHAGNHAGIVAAYSELIVYLADLDTDPSPATTGLFNELTRRHEP